MVNWFHLLRPDFCPGDGNRWSVCSSTPNEGLLWNRWEANEGPQLRRIIPTRRGSVYQNHFYNWLMTSRIQDSGLVVDSRKSCSGIKSALFIPPRSIPHFADFDSNAGLRVFGVLLLFSLASKPAAGIPLPGKDGVICKYPSDPSVALGALAAVLLPVTALIGVLSVFYPYNGVTVPGSALFQSTALFVFFIISVGLTVLGEGMTIWATATEGLHRVHSIHHNPDAECPTAKTGLFGGAAFVALDAALFWLICIMPAMNAREDCLDEEDPKGHCGQVTTADLDVNAPSRINV